MNARVCLVCVVVCQVIVIGVFVGYQIYESVVTYQKPSNSVSVRAEQQRIPFPLLRFCGLNPDYEPKLSNCEFFTTQQSLCTITNSTLVRRKGNDTYVSRC